MISELFLFIDSMDNRHLLSIQNHKNYNIFQNGAI